ncbi:MAG: BsuPI-related putative proteinase inhibitor [Gemmatimonas sp.]
MRLIILGLIGVVACQHVTSPQADVEVSARLSSAEFRAGDTVRLTVTVTNRGEVIRELNTAECPAPFVVTTENGAEVGPAEHACTLQLAMKTLAPGESFIYTVPWSGDARSAPRLPPGRYLLRARVPAKGGLIEGDPIAFRILP